MGSNPPKEKGNSGKCFKCNNPIYCREKEYNGQVSLQWQNQEGGAHYNKDGTCKDQLNPGAPQSIAQKVTETKVVWEKLEEPSEDQKQLVAGLREVRSLAYDFTKEGHPELSENTNLFGQIVNANISHLLALAQIKATKESS